MRKVLPFNIPQVIPIKAKAFDDPRRSFTKVQICCHVMYPSCCIRSHNGTGWVLLNARTIILGTSSILKLLGTETVAINSLHHFACYIIVAIHLWRRR